MARLGGSRPPPFHYEIWSNLGDDKRTTTAACSFFAALQAWKRLGRQLSRQTSARPRGSARARGPQGATHTAHMLGRRVCNAKYCWQGSGGVGG
eukprot:3640273-Pyramimonas_sp.AAC.1